MSESLHAAGLLEETSLPILLLWAHDSSFTGVLALAREEIKKSIILEKGRAVAGRSNVTEESLGFILQNEGRITEVQLKKSLEMLKAHQAAHHGEALVLLGLIDAPMLNEILRKQLLSRIYDLFTWTSGRYAYIPGIPEGTAKMVVEETLPEICFRGLVQKYKATKLSIDLSLKPVPIGGRSLSVEGFKLVGREMGFFRSINGVHSIDHIVKKSRMDEDTSIAMLRAFADLGLVRIGAPDAADEKRRSTPPVTQKPSSPPPPLRPASPPVLAAKRPPVVDEIEERMRSADNQNHFEVLGVKRDATTDQIKKAYFELARKFHPDRLPVGVTAKDRKIAEGYFSCFSQAHSILGSADSKKEYEATLSLEADGVSAESAKQIMQSEVEFQKGQALSRKGDFAGAIETLSRAISLYDKEPEYHSELGWAVFRNASRTKSSRDVQRAKESIEAALHMNEDLVQAIFYLGMIRKSEGDTKGAARLFSKVAELQPRHAEANSELRLINRRKEKQQSGLKGLFGKKG